jgi:hypothetical protein
VRNATRPAIGAMVGILLCSTLVPAMPARAQSITQAWAGASMGVFDGFGIGLTHYANSAGIGLGVSVATGTSPYADYGIYDNDRGRGYGDVRYGGGYGFRDRGYSDYCWDRSWDLRWDRRYYGWDSYGYPRYDHLDFYHDCLSGGVGYAYSRWGAHARRDRYYDDWGRHGRGRGWGVSVQIYVTDPFWRPWGPYWSYDPWGWYWDGFRDGRRSRGWGSYGGTGWGPGVRTVWNDGRAGWSRPSPLGPGYKEDPNDRRTAVPRGGRAVAGSAPAVGESVGPSATDTRTAGSRRPAGDIGRSARPGVDAGVDGGAVGRAVPGVRAPDRGIEGGPTARARPTDELRGGSRTARPESGPAIEEGGRAGRAEPAAPRARGSDRTEGGSLDDAPPTRATPRTRPSDGVRAPDGGGAEPRTRAPGAIGGDDGPVLRDRGGSDAPVLRDRGTRSPEPRGEPAPSVRERPSSPSSGRSGGERAPSVREGGERSSPATRSGGGERSAPAIRSGGGERSAPAARSGGGERSAPAARSGGGERSAPSTRSGGGERSAPSTRSGGGERSAPAVRSGGGESSGSTARRRGGDEQR